MKNVIKFLSYNFLIKILALISKPTAQLSNAIHEIRTTEKSTKELSINSLILVYVCVFEEGGALPFLPSHVGFPIKTQKH